MGYARSAPYFTRIYCLLFRRVDDIEPCLPGVALMSLIAAPVLQMAIRAYDHTEANIRHIFNSLRQIMSQ